MNLSSTLSLTSPGLQLALKESNRHQAQATSDELRMALSSTSALTPSTSFSALSTKWQHLDSTANPGRSGAPSAADPRRSGFGGSEGKRVPNTLVQQ